MPGEASPTHLGWDLAGDVNQLLEYHFMVNALLAGTVVAILAGSVGWLVVLRREAFAGHTLSVMAFPGAAAAALLAVPAAWGYFLASAAGALAIAASSSSPRRSWGEQSAAIGAVQAAALAVGFLLVSLYGGILSDLEGQLFGTFLGVSDGRLLTLALVACAVLALLAVLARPLLLVSVDPELAASRGLRVRLISAAFLLALALAVAATSQITGVLLVFALLVGPPASAQALTARPAAGLALSVALGVLVAWIGLGLSYFSSYPAGFFIATTSTVLYLTARAAGALWPRLRPRRDGLLAAAG